MFYNYYHMSSNSQTYSTQMLESKPYLTKQEVGFLLQKKGRNLDKKILQLLSRNYLLSLKKGLYTTDEYVKSSPKQVREFFANSLYYPSYVSLEYVLQSENIIPEAVYAYTSITLRPTKTFTNSLGTFIYRTVKPALFTGYESVRFTDNYTIKNATRVKALFDLLYLKSMPADVKAKKQELLDLRIRWESFNRQDVEEFNRYAALVQSRKMKDIAVIISKLIV